MAKTILIVEDDPKSMTLTKDLLKISGYEAIQAVNGRQGVEMAKSKLPDLILMDIMMPEMDGYAACHEIKINTTTSKIPVIMLTAVGFDLNRKLARQYGAQGYITKPFSHQDLVDAITALLPNS
jgi:DNA-binding response OmpR family regulator